VALLASACLVATSGVARAEADTLDVGDTTSALPGVVRVPVAGGQPRAGIGAAASGGYGRTESVLANSDAHHRAFGTLAGSARYRWFAIGLRLDGRYDWHRHVPDGNGGGWVGDPRLVLRLGTDVGAGLAIGAQGGVWFPGKSAPSVDVAAISPELVVLATYGKASVPLALASQVGFRLDRSAATVPNPDGLVRADRLALGVSDTNALLLGIGGVLRIGDRVEALGEWSWDLRMPAKGVSAGDSPMRIDAGARLTPTPSGTTQLQLVVELCPSGRPDIGRGAPLVAVEPRVTFLAGLNFRPALPPERMPMATDVGAPADAVQTRLAREVKTGSVRGRVTDEGGRGVSGARIHFGPVQGGVDLDANAEGAFEGRELAPGRTEVTVSAEGYRQQARKLEIAAGKSEELEFRLQRALPAGQIRGLVRSFSGATIGATIRIEPIGKEAVVGEGGRFELDVPPGDYDVIVKASGYADQHRRVRVEANGVVVLNLDMRRR
jgi:hypothetical protein